MCAVARTVKSDSLRRGHTRLIARDLASCAGNKEEWTFALTLDDYPWETSWAIKDSAGNLISSGPPAGMNYARRGEYADTGCLTPGDYTLTVKDISGDGLCCQYGSGRFELTVNDAIVAESDDTEFKTLDFAFTVSAKTEAPSTPRPTNKPTPRPSKKPTNIPSKQPTNAPSPPPTRVSEILHFNIFPLFFGPSHSNENWAAISVPFQETYNPSYNSVADIRTYYFSYRDTDEITNEEAILCTRVLANTDTNKSTNRDANKSANRDTNKSTNRDTNKSANRDANKSTNRDINKSAN